MLYQAFYDFLSGEQGLSALTVEAYRSDLEQLRTYIKDELGENDDPRQLSLQHLRLWLVSLSKRGVKASSIKRKVAAVHTFYRYLVRRHGLGTDPSLRLTAPKGGKVLAAFVPQEQTEKFWTISTRPQTTLSLPATS